MAEPYYNHPGEVREAMNFQCLHCDKIFSTPQGLCGHLYRLHKIKTQDIQHKQDWEVTNKIADDNTPSPSINRNISTTISGDRRMKSKQELTYNLECIVPGCGKVYSSSAGMSMHQRKAHGQGSKRDVNWRWTKKPTTINDLRSRASQERKGIGKAAAEQPRTIDTKAEGSNLKCLVEGCGRVLGSLPGMVGHLRRKHGQGARKSVNWARTNEPLAQEGRGRGRTVPASTKQPRTKRQPVMLQPSPLILSPDSKYIEIAAVIRVPITIGQAEILQEEG